MSNDLNKLLLVNHCSPGDVAMLTAAVRDLHLAYPGEYVSGVDTCFRALWTDNPYVSELDPQESGVRRIDCNHPPMLDRCNETTRHYVESMHDVLAQAIGRPVPPTRLAPDLHLSAGERTFRPVGLERPYSVIVGGGKRDVTIKWWPASYYQRVVDCLRGRVQFVQAGSKDDHHPPLQGVINLVGKTNLREFLQLIYHSDGVLCPVTFAMHAAAAFDKPCVVVAGGREPVHWEMYPTHQFLHTVGQLPCCAAGGCWKARVVPLGDGDGDRDRNLCRKPLRIAGEHTAACMGMIEPTDVVRAIERYMRGLRTEQTEA